MVRNHGTSGVRDDIGEEGGQVVVVGSEQSLFVEVRRGCCRFGGKRPPQTDNKDGSEGTATLGVVGVCLVVCVCTGLQAGFAKEKCLKGNREGHVESANGVSAEKKAFREWGPGVKGVLWWEVIGCVVLKVGCVGRGFGFGGEPQCLLGTIVGGG